MKQVDVVNPVAYFMRLNTYDSQKLLLTTLFEHEQNGINCRQLRDCSCVICYLYVAIFLHWT